MRSVAEPEVPRRVFFVHIFAPPDNRTHLANDVGQVVNRISHLRRTIQCGAGRFLGRN